MGGAGSDEYTGLYAKANAEAAEAVMKAQSAATELSTEELAAMMKELQKGIGAIDEKVSKHRVVPGRVIHST